ncbi:MAG: helix-turn-helix domain-containing protein [Anaerolineales bacterium]|nr:helix-turn-helix domain-containing protein [Anaerolineales bacterium]
MSITIPVSLTTILEPLPSDDYEWICGGEKSAATSISWVVCNNSEIRDGDLLLLDVSEALQIREEDSQAGRPSAVGLIGPGDIDPSAWPGKPVFRIFTKAASRSERGAELRAVHQTFLKALLTQKSLLLERGAAIQTRLTQIAACGEGLAGLAAAMREMTQHGMLVQDKRLAPLASSPSADLRMVWDDLLVQLADFSALPETLRDRRQAGQAPSAILDSMPGGLERVIVPIVVGDVARGYLSAVGAVGELDPTDRLVAEQGALVCAIEMARAKAVRETEKRLHGDLLSALLHRNLSARDAHLWAQNLGLDLGQQHTAMRLAWEGSAPTLRRLETLVNGEISRSGRPVIVSSLSGEVICFCESPRQSGRPSAAIALAQTVIDLAAKEHPEAVIRCGIGTPAAELGSWQLSFRQAGQALDMARRLGERKPLYYMDLTVYRLLLQFEDHPELNAFLQETLGPVMNHENADEFLTSLEEFFKHNGNLSQTAEALFIHRNTLTYRLERLAGVAQLDLENPETRLAVQLALSIRRMLKAA